MTKINEYLPRHPLGWKYDLALPHEEPTQRLNSLPLPPTPSKINNTYLEIPRSSVSIRGIASIGGSITLSFGLILYLYTTLSTITEIGISEAKIIAIGLTITTAAYWAMIPFVRLDIELPRNEPIRFNRLRQKVYFYEYRFDRFYIFSRKKWGVRPVAYDWKDLIAEVCSVYAPMGNGGLVENVLIAVRKPGTDEIIDRLFFTHSIEDGKRYWEIIRLFMQQGPDALPTFVRPPRNWDNDFELTPIRRLAPRVQWPEAIDRESRTGPAAGEHT
ncbi:hypothetical protein PUR31_15365 [Pseudomonas mosselii]|uniref:DUF6708 domain-containing protein n=1 Tax=unclassified Pseudomonas TaxID=196821 RepID=UPI001F413BDE|nr:MULTISPECIES: DUF6708 domain-containing protein [unclassified Pseudomonas]MCF1489457.1 hypothetical protein [Pseudomonas sp. AA27]MCP8634877.1 hypothetical protein [Pseudomonas sp. DVZ6]MDD7785470.1 hypothetical protein [Pseudomonas sp. DVZ24]